MNLNRNTPPKIYSVDGVEYIEPKCHKLSNGVELFTMKSGDQEVVKLDFMFKAGSWYAKSRLDSMMAALMLQEGTESLNASQIANTFDFYGAQFSSNSSYDNNYVTLVALNKYLPELLPLVSDILTNASFPESEFEILRQKRKQKALVDAERVGLVAQRGFLRNLFGEGHPYAPVASPASYDTLLLSDVKQHYKNFYRSDNMSIIASGFIDSTVIELIAANFSLSWGKNDSAITNDCYRLPKAKKSITIEKEGANQNAIAIGKLFPKQDHPDFPGLKLLCTILGGYFGSRLMTNIREEKGYTYGIQASPISFQQEGVLLIFAEVKMDKTSEAIKEVFYEMDRLTKELITEQELIPIQNYLLGRILEDFDGPFARAQTFASLREVELNFDYYTKLIETFKTTTPQQIRALAKKYLKADSMITVVAGTK